MLLALDTSTSFASVAVVQKPARLVVERNWDAGQHHSRDLFVRLDWLMQTQHLAWADLTAVAVSTGPGSWSGLRVALATAKSLCFARDLPLYTCPTLDVIGWGGAGGWSSAAGRIWALLDAGRGQVYAAQYPSSPGDGQFRPLDGYHVLTPGELAEKIAAESDQAVLFCGEWLAATREQLAESLGGCAAFASTLPSRRASWLAELALEQAERGEHADILSVEPLYLRRPAISKSPRLELLSHTSDNASQTEADDGLSGRRGRASHALHR